MGIADEKTLGRKNLGGKKKRILFYLTVDNTVYAPIKDVSLVRNSDVSTSMDSACPVKNVLEQSTREITRRIHKKRTHSNNSEEYFTRAHKNNAHTNFAKEHTTRNSLVRVKAAVDHWHSG